MKIHQISVAGLMGLFGCLAVTASAGELTNSSSRAPLEAMGKEATGLVGSKNFGVLHVSSVTVHALDLGGVSAAEADRFLAAPGHQRTCASPGCSLAAGIHLPNGVRIKGIEVDLFDNDSGGNVHAELKQCEVGSDSCDTVAQVATSMSDQPGRVQLLDTLGIGPIVDNVDNSYVVSAGITGTSTDTGLVAVRVFFRRQVSPEPATATFGDVPTSHPFFQHVEALADSGITSGCGGGNFCPDQSVTRGQMAVFMATALGLHWPSLLTE